MHPRRPSCDSLASALWRLKQKRRNIRISAKFVRSVGTMLHRYRLGFEQRLSTTAIVPHAGHSNCLRSPIIQFGKSGCSTSSRLRSIFSTASNQPINQPNQVHTLNSSPLFPQPIFFRRNAIRWRRFAYSDRSVCHLSVCRVVYSDQTVKDRPIVCIEDEYECGDERDFDWYHFRPHKSTITPPLPTPKWGSKWRGVIT